MNTNQVVTALHAYYAVRAAEKEKIMEKKRCYAELVVMAVELGMDQGDALNGSAKDWLDGYLVGSGRIPANRDKP